MEEWILAEEVIEKLGEVNLLAAVNSGNVTAFNAHTDKPINWVQLQDEFEAIAALCDEQYREDEGSFRRISATDRTRKAVVLKKRPSICDDCHPVPWNILYKYLSSGRQVEIPETQYFQILEGWGNNQIILHLQEAKFRQTEIMPFLPTEDEKPTPNETHKNDTRSFRNPEGSRILTGQKEISEYFGASWQTVKKYAKGKNWLFHNEKNKPITSTFEIDEFKKASSSKKKKILSS